MKIHTSLLIRTFVCAVSIINLGFEKGASANSLEAQREQLLRKKVERMKPDLAVTNHEPFPVTLEVLKREAGQQVGVSLGVVPALTTLDLKALIFPRISQGCGELFLIRAENKKHAYQFSTNISIPCQDMKPFRSAKAVIGPLPRTDENVLSIKLLKLANDGIRRYGIALQGAVAKKDIQVFVRRFIAKILAPVLSGDNIGFGDAELVVRTPASLARLKVESNVFNSSEGQKGFVILEQNVKGHDYTYILGKVNEPEVRLKIDVRLAANCEATLRGEEIIFNPQCDMVAKISELGSEDALSRAFEVGGQKMDIQVNVPDSFEIIDATLQKFFQKKEANDHEFGLMAYYASHAIAYAGDQKKSDYLYGLINHLMKSVETYNGAYRADYLMNIFVGSKVYKRISSDQNNSISPGDIENVISELKGEYGHEKVVYSVVNNTYFGKIISEKIVQISQLKLEY